MTRSRELAELATAYDTGGLSSFKNRLINGAMGVWQRATTWTGTASLGSSGYTTADRWTFYAASSMTASQSTSVPSGFQYSLKVQRPNAAVTTNPMFAVQVVESNNMVDLAGQSVTLSFWAKAGANFSASGSVLGVGVNTGTTADQGSATGLGGWTGSAQPLALSQAITTTWTKYSVTGTIAANALELDVVFSYTPTGTAGADDAFYITGVQLEKGSTATSFDYRPYGTELALCQRYFYNFPSTYRYDFGVSGASGEDWFIPFNHPVNMRAAPTVTGGASDITISWGSSIRNLQMATGAVNGGHYVDLNGATVSAEL